MLIQTNGSRRSFRPPAKRRIAITVSAAVMAVGAGVSSLAFQWQRHSENAAREARHCADADRAQREVQAHTVAVAELHSRAIDQLGSGKALVRLGGLYALERLGQDIPDRRQTVVDLLCTYLRMPCTAPAEIDPVRVGRCMRARQELQVRLTAQRLLARHLRPGPNLTPTATYWGELDLDLTGALLVDLDLRACRLRGARFDGATFSGETRFEGATFSGDAVFDTAVFRGPAQFNGTTFGDGAWFGTASFHENARFSGATFSGFAGFGRTVFGGFAWFRGATFHDGARFYEAVFMGLTTFELAGFTGPVVFEGAAVTGEGRHRWPRGWSVAFVEDGRLGLVPTEPDTEGAG